MDSTLLSGVELVSHSYQCGSHLPRAYEVLAIGLRTLRLSLSLTSRTATGCRQAF